MEVLHTSSQSVPTEDFRMFLRRELIRRTGKNPKYSLRAFARYLGVTAPVLSHLLSGKRPMKPVMVQKLGLALGLNLEEIQRYEQLQVSLSPDQGDPLASFSTLTLDLFSVISEWYHDAILELTHLNTFQPEPRWIAKTLGLSIHEVHAAVERLLRLNLLRIDEHSKWHDRSQDNTTQIHADFTSAALRKYQEQILLLSSQALANVPKSLRDHSSTMTAIDLKDLPEVKNRIRRFRKELSDFLQRDGVKPNQVYQLAIAYFPLTKSNFPESLDRTGGSS